MKVVVQVGSGQVGTVLARALHDFELRNELERSTSSFSCSVAMIDTPHTYRILTRSVNRRASNLRAVFGKTL